jgi:hypothetical protein
VGDATSFGNVGDATDLFGTVLALGGCLVDCAKTGIDNAANRHKEIRKVDLAMFMAMLKTRNREFSSY